MRAQVLVAMGLLYFVWGSTYLAIRVTVETLQPLVAGGVRFILAGCSRWPHWRRSGASARGRARPSCADRPSPGSGC